MNETFTMDQMRAIVAYELSKEAPVLNTGNVVTQADPQFNVIGNWVIVRGDRSGVFFGNVESLDPATNEVILTDVRHIWRWEGAANTAELAAHGVGKPEGCKFAAAGHIMVWDAIEVIPCSAHAVTSLSAVELWEENA